MQFAGEATDRTQLVFTDSRGTKYLPSIGCDRLIAERHVPEFNVLNLFQVPQRQNIHGAEVTKLSTLGKKRVLTEVSRVMSELAVSAASEARSSSCNKQPA